MPSELTSSGISQGERCLDQQPMQDRVVRNETQCEQPTAAINQPNKIRNILIKEVNRGFIVEVGCHTFAISTRAELTTKLTEYINEPDKTEKKWYDNNLF